jgi:hypothetical protein
VPMAKYRVIWKSETVAENEVPLYALCNPGMMGYMRSADNTWYQCAT